VTSSLRCVVLLSVWSYESEVYKRSEKVAKLESSEYLPFTRYHYGDRNQEDEMGGAYGMGVRKEKFVYSFSMKT
jgi:hypothetical protein